MYRKSLAVRLGSFVNLLVSINTEGNSDRQVREKNLQSLGPGQLKPEGCVHEIIIIIIIVNNFFTDKTV